MKVDKDFELKKLIENIAEAIMKLFKSCYKDGDGALTLSEFEKNIKHHLDNHVESDSPFGKWANDNMKDFMKNSLDFANEHNKELMQLFDSGKYGEISDLVVNGVARDLGLDMQSKEMPAELATDPNRKSEEHIGKAMSGVSSLEEEMDSSAIGDVADIVVENSTQKMSEPVLSKYEKDNNLSFDDKPASERIKDHGFNSEGQNDELDYL